MLNKVGDLLDYMSKNLGSKGYGCLARKPLEYKHSVELVITVLGC